MSFIKKAMLLGGVPVRPTTKKNRYAKKSMKELQRQGDHMARQTAALEAIARQNKQQ